MGSIKRKPVKNLIIIILKSLLFTVLSSPFFAVIALVYHMSVKNILTIPSITNELTSLFAQKTCSALNLSQITPCILQENTKFLIFLASFAGLVFLTKATKNIWQKSKLFQKISNNIGFFSLLLPVIYYAYVYLPVTLTANNPLAFLFLASAVFIHILAITFIDYLHSSSFKS